MNDFDCSLSCSMKFGLQKSIDKLTFLKDKCPAWSQTESIGTLSGKDLHCSLCLLDMMIDTLAKEEFECLNREIIRVVMIRSYIQNVIDLKDLQLEAENLSIELDLILKRRP